MKKIILCVLFLMLQSSYFLLSQTNKKFEKPVFGLNYGFNLGNRACLELGYGLMTNFRYHKGKRSVIYDRSCLVLANLSCEVQLSRALLLGPKISTRYSFELWDWEFNYWGFVFGADYIAYNNFRNFNHIFRPSIGVHYFLDVFELTYGYNIRLDSNSCLPIGQHLIQFSFKPFVFIELMKSAWG